MVSSRSGLVPLSVPYKNSNTNWSVHSAKGSNSLTYNNRKSVTFSRAQDADTFDQKFYGAYRTSASAHAPASVATAIDPKRNW